MDTFREIFQLFEDLREEMEKDDDKETYAFPCTYGDCQTSSPQPGDIIGIDRGGYEHYGIYAGDDCVIHFTAETSDLDEENAAVRETTLKQFLRGDIPFFVLEHYKWHARVQDWIASKHGKNSGANASKATGKDEPLGEEQGRLYSPAETVKRARNRIGERKRNLLTKNGMQFAVWCKTGISDSDQARQWMAWCTRTTMGK